MFVKNTWSLRPECRAPVPAEPYEHGSDIRESPDSPPLILLVHLAETDFLDIARERILGHRSCALYKIGLHYLCAVLARKGWRCVVADQTFEPFTIAELAQRCSREHPAAVGFYTSTSHREQVVAAIGTLRDAHPALFVLCGGPGAADAGTYLAAGADAVVHGEGEVTLPSLLRARDQGSPLDDVQGISFRTKNGSVVRTAARPLIEDLDAIPFPQLTREIVAKNRDSVVDHDRTQIQVLASRGCPFSCAFCASHSHWGRRLRMRTVANVMTEIDRAVERYGAGYVYFLDDIFGWRRRWLEEFAEAMRRRPGLMWSCNVHPFSFAWDPEGAVRMLAAAGLKSMTIGLQSIEPATQRLMRRFRDEPDRAARLVAAARASRVRTTLQFIFGLPADDAGTFDRLFDYLVRVRPNDVDTFALKNLHGSEFGERPPPPSVMSRAEIDRRMLRLTRRFYTHPYVALANIRDVLRRNPMFLVTGAPRLLWRLRCR